MPELGLVFISPRVRSFREDGSAYGNIDQAAKFLPAESYYQRGMIGAWRL